MAELLVVDDDAMVRDLLVHVLTRAGHRARSAADGAGLRAALDERPADLVLLDQTMPGEDGITLARWLRGASPEIGIVLVSGQGEAIDRIAGLEAGADDYVGKPFEPAELLARIEAVLRRRLPCGGEGLRLGPWRIDGAAGHLVHDDGRVLRLTPSEVPLVLAFARHPGRVLSREALLELAPARDEDAFDRSIDHRIVRLRRRIEPDPRRPELIRSLRGRGYLYRG